MYSKKVIEIYANICGCKSLICAEFPEIYNYPSKGSPPRGFFTEAQGEIDILVVGKNPGRVLESEAKLYLDLNGAELVKTHLEFSKNTFNKINQLNKKERQSTKFHSNLIEYMNFVLGEEGDEIFKKVAYTNLVKCSTRSNEQAKLTRRSIDECFNRHLVNEINYFNPKIIFALGREVEKYLNTTNVIEKYPLVYIKHPSYHYKKEQKLAKLNELKNHYRNALR